MRIKNNLEIYETPEITLLELEVEAGIAQSGGNEPGRAPALNYSQRDDIYL